MKEEAPHHAAGLNRGKKERQREQGSVYEREKPGDYLRDFCEMEAPTPSTCSDIVLTTIHKPKAIMIRLRSYTSSVVNLSLNP